MYKDFCTFDMLEELVPEADAFRSPFDKARNIGYYKALFVLKVNNSKVWINCSKVIICDLWTCVRNGCKEQRSGNR